MANTEVALEDRSLPSTLPPLVIGVVAGPDALSGPPAFLADLPAGQNLVRFYVRHMEEKAARESGEGSSTVPLAEMTEG